MTADESVFEQAEGVKDGGLMALWDWRRQVAGLYAGARTMPEPEGAWRHWRTGRDRLFGTHPQSPLEPEPRRAFRSLPFFAYDPALRFAVGVSPIDEPSVSFEAGQDGQLQMRPFGRTIGLAAPLGGELTLFWISGYGGGVFLPFADATSGADTYGAGRYLLDTMKSADLGTDPSGRLILDFNFAYNPSCCYSARYVCPLAPRTNRLPRPVRAGELTWPAG